MKTYRDEINRANIITWKVEAVDMKWEERLPHMKAEEETPDRIPNTEARRPSPTLSAYKWRMFIFYILYVQYTLHVYWDSWILKFLPRRQEQGNVRFHRKACQWVFSERNRRSSNTLTCCRLVSLFSCTIRLIKLVEIENYGLHW